MEYDDANRLVKFNDEDVVYDADGNKPIEEIQAGDLVYSTNPETGESEYKEVLRTFRKETDVLIHIFVNGEEIQTTPVHPFWVENQWVAAKDLEIGDVLTLADGTTAPVTYTYGEQLHEPVIVYNFEVAEFHTYYVTDTGVLVHNLNRFGCGSNNVEKLEHNFDLGNDNSNVNKEGKILYHYTNEKGMNGILESNQLKPSLKVNSPNDCFYGEGQYLSDIVPGTKTPAQLSRNFIHNPFQGARYSHFVGIDVTDLNVVYGRENVYVIPNVLPLDLTNRIISYGKVIS